MAPCDDEKRDTDLRCSWPRGYGNLATDLTDTPDNIDMRLLGGRSDDDTVIVLSSIFDFTK